MELHQYFMRDRGHQSTPEMSPQSVEMPHWSSSSAESLLVEPRSGRRKVLFIDTDVETHQLAADALEDQGIDVLCSLEVEDALAQLNSNHDEVASLSAVFYALGRPANHGLRIFARLRQAARGVPVFLLASRDAMEAAKTALQLGASGYLLKPFIQQELIDLMSPASPANLFPVRIDSASRSPLGRTPGAFPSRALVARSQAPLPSAAAPPPLLPSAGSTGSAGLPNMGLGALASKQDPLGQFIGRAPGMQRVFALIRKVAASDVSVLVTGESGSGKEMVASAIHQCSSREGRPFIAINCAAIPKELLESELFGHAKGAFTGATTARRGLFEEAHEGTVLLDEIGDLPLPLQAKILRLLQTKEVKPLGQNIVKEINVRIISATHKNLKALIQKGEFREDLYYRLNVMPIQLPPLRERREDVPLLAEHFLRKHSPSVGRRLFGFSKGAISKLQSLPWRGNVRELENTVERAMVMAEGSWIEDCDIIVDEIGTDGNVADDLFNSGKSLKDIEREYIRHVLAKTGNRKEAATRILGIDRKTLYRKEKLYGIRLS